MAQQPRGRAPAPAQPAAIGAVNQDAGGIFVDQQDATDLAPRDFADGDATGFLENVRASFDSTLRSGLTVSKARSKAIAYEPIMAALNKGVDRPSQLTNPWTGASRGGAGRIRARQGHFGIDFSSGLAGVTPEEQEAAIWAEIGRRRRTDPGFLPGVPKSRQELDTKIDDDDRRALEADDDVTRRASVWGSAGGFVGGVGASFRDPINVVSLPLGAGSAKTILGAALREGAINAGLTAVAQPAIAARSNELGREYGLDDAVTSTLYAGVGGAVLGGGAKGLERGAKMLGDRIARQRVGIELGRDKVMRFVMHKLEGGSAVVDYSDADGGVTKWGIAKKFNPDVDVANLTEEGALDISRRRYWSAALDKLDPRAAAIAYDAGFLAGPKVRARVIDAVKDGDWRAGVAAFRREMARKATKPGKEKYAKGWQKRIDRLEAFVDSAGGPRARTRPDGTYPPATADEVSAAITLEGLDELGRTSPLPAGPAGDARHLETLQGHIDALEEGAPRPEVSVQPMELKRPDGIKIESFDPRELAVDPTRFQFKAGGDEKGVLDTLKGVSEWNPILSGKAVVWVDNAGKAFIADGHQRHGLASRLLSENPSADIRIDGVVLREADGITPEKARVWAALKNVAEGSGSPVDAAKVIRGAGENAQIPLPPRSALVRDARSLATLSDDAFGMVVNEVVPPAYAAIVGRLAPGAPELHAAYLQLLHRLEPATATQADSIVRQAIAAGATKETQLGLFGEEIVSRSLYLERARVLDNSLRRLKNDKRVFRTLIDAKDDIEGAGNVLDAGANAAKVENNAQALEILTRLAHRTGPVSDALGRAAGELAAGRSARAAVDRFIAELDGLDLSDLARGVERSDGDGLAAGGLGREGGAVGAEPGVSGSAADRASGADAGGADDGLGDPIGEDLFGNPVYAERADALDELDGPAVLEAAVDDAQEAMQLDGFDDVHAGSAAVRQSELLEHDVRMDAENARQAAQDGAGGANGADEPVTTRIGRNEITDDPSEPGGIRGFDMGQAGERLRAAADEGLARGATVTLHIGEREIPIVSAGMVDEQGQRWGAMSIVSPKPGERAELVIVEARPSSQDSAAGGKNGSGPSSASGTGRNDRNLPPTSQPSPDATNMRRPGMTGSRDATTAGTTPEGVGTYPNEMSMTPPHVVTPDDPLGLGNIGEQVNPQTAERVTQMAQLGAQSPLRSAAEQADVDGLGLFDTARSPELFAIIDRLDVDRGATPELRTVDDLLAELDADDAAIAAIEGCLV